MKATYLCRNSIAMAIALTAIATGTQAASSYTITPLGTDEIGLSGPVPTAISSSGFVTGSAFNLDSYNAVIWDTSGNPQLLFPNTTSESFAIDINATNQVLIDPYLIWDKGVVTSLAAGNTGATIIGGQINDATQLSFTRLTLVNGQYLYRASRADYSSAIELGVLPGQTQSWANNLNNSGDVVGYSYTTSYIETRATLWRNGNIIDVGVLSGQTNSTATDINDNGRIVGTSGGRLFTWENGVMSDLGTISDLRGTSNFGSVSSLGGTSDLGGVHGFVLAVGVIGVGCLGAGRGRSPYGDRWGRRRRGCNGASDACSASRNANASEDGQEQFLGFGGVFHEPCLLCYHPENPSDGTMMRA